MSVNFWSLISNYKGFEKAKSSHQSRRETGTIRTQAATILEIAVNPQQFQHQNHDWLVVQFHHRNSAFTH